MTARSSAFPAAAIAMQTTASHASKTPKQDRALATTPPHTLSRQAPLASVAPNSHLRPQPPPPPRLSLPSHPPRRHEPRPPPSHPKTNSHPTYPSPRPLCLRPSFAAPPCTSCYPPEVEHRQARVALQQWRQRRHTLGSKLVLTAAKGGGGGGGVSTGGVRGLGEPGSLSRGPAP